MIGRQREQDELLRRYRREKAEFIAIYGRRRVGKTYLVDETFSGKITFSHAGLTPLEESRTGALNRQLENFYYSLQRFGAEPDHVPKDWMEAFYMLEKWLDQKDNGERQVVFLDELPWLDTPRSNFISALESFWNNWGCHKKNLMLIVCGSASSWILDQLINNHGGLYNRVTCQISLSPFTLKECEQFYKENDVHLSRYDIVQSYMILGGIPYYMDYVRGDLSFAQSIDEMFFSKKPILQNEFDRLFASVFSNPGVMKSIVSLLATRRAGFTRSEIAEKLNIKAGGTLSKYMDALVGSDFVTKYNPFGRTKKESYYKLTDPFCLFWIHFNNQPRKPDYHFWVNNQNAAAISSWRGLAFEDLCFDHIDQIRKALDIYGVRATYSAWIGQDEELGGAQIDLVIDRDDHVVNLCELKFTSNEFTVDKAYRNVLSNREEIIRKIISPKNVIRHTLITTYGLKLNEYSGIFSNVITLEDLFT